MPCGSARSQAVGKRDGGTGFDPQGGYAGAPGIGGAVPDSVDSALCSVPRRETVYAEQRGRTTVGNAPVAGAGRRADGLVRIGD